MTANRIGPQQSVSDAAGVVWSIGADGTVLRSTSGRATQGQVFGGAFHVLSPRTGTWWKATGNNSWREVGADPAPVIVPPPPPPSPVPLPVPTPPPVPVFPPVGALKMTTTAVPLTGPAFVLANGKHFDFARLGNRWYLMAGDHGATGDPLDIAIPPPDAQGGRNERLSVNIPANDWREDTPYYLPASYGVQGSNPDDTAFVITVGSEIWVAGSETNRYGILATPTGAAEQFQLRDTIGAYTPPSTQWPLGHWRKVAPTPNMLHGNRAWRGFYDPVKSRIVVPCTTSGSLTWCLIDVPSGNDLSQYTPDGAIYTWGAHSFATAGLAADFDKRKFYLYDIMTCELWVADMDTLALSKVANIPEQPAGTQSALKITWHPDLRAVILNLVKTHAFEVDSGKLTSWTRLDGYTDLLGFYNPTSTLFYDPDTRDIVSIGITDFHDGGGPWPNSYWRLKIEAA